MLFLFAALLLMYFGRKLGWRLSRTLLYRAPLALTMFLCALWGCAVALTIYALINWQHPGPVLRWVAGYFLGAYVAVPNFGLVNERTIPQEAQGRHQAISLVPLLVYTASSWAFAVSH